jgi:hypothetical protein
MAVTSIKTIPCTPLSHPFVERLIGTVRREYLDQTLFWNRGDLERKLDNYQAAVTPGSTELRRRNAEACPYSQSQNLSHIPGGNIAMAYFRPSLLPKLEFDTDRCFNQFVTADHLAEIAHDLSSENQGCARRGVWATASAWLTDQTRDFVEAAAFSDSRFRLAASNISVSWRTPLGREGERTGNGRAGRQLFFLRDLIRGDPLSARAHQP